MNQLKLHYDLLKGEFSLKELNFLFAFQVNCPGCFIYGIPLVNHLYKSFKGDISFLGLSTAFEDFEYNNMHNTNKLLKQRELVGVTKEHFGQKYGTGLDFPVAMDRLAEASFDFDTAAQELCRTNEGYLSLNESQREEYQLHVTNYLKSLDQLSLTFTLNHFRGTPTFVVFDDRMNILYSSFGYVAAAEMEGLLTELVNHKLLTR